ncbi:MAG TPA: aromatic-ring-hydroxylating dioxygenase subunit beta [Acetobacteraceae bacterium]|nr:aromatic-ring-hydroxylating dioxygenase subunit beta [Acetobacteraceae bacterium]
MTDPEIARFIYREARLLDEKRWDVWYALFTEDGHYWVPLTRNQPDAEMHTSLAYEDKLLLRLRIERLRRRPPSQRPGSWSQHVLQAPEIETADSGTWLTRTAFHYAEARGDAMQTLTGVMLHELVRQDSALRIRLKRVDLLNCDAALPSIQLFL